MKKTQGYKPYNDVDYYILPSGYADVFMHKNMSTELDEDGNTLYIADEVYFQVHKSVTKEKIEQNFEFMWNDAIEEKPSELTDKERLELVEEKNTVQDEVIDIALMATDEMYMMIEPLLANQPMMMNLENVEGGSSKMVDMYVAMVIRGLKTIDEVPARYRAKVQAILDKLEK